MISPVAEKRASARGICPACSTRISWFDAAWRGRNKPFACLGCGASLVKTSVRLWVVMSATFTVLAIKSRTDDWTLVAFAFLAGCIGLVIDARLRTPIALVDSPETLAEA